MRAGQTLVDDNGYQVALFPLEYIYISQGENGTYSHQGILAIDFLGYGANGRILKCPYYAPCDCKVVYHASYYNVWQSLNQVHTPSGIQYINFVVIHDDNPPPLGTTKLQGEEIGKTGTNPPQSVTGDHLHLNTSLGTYQGFYTVSSGKRQLVNSSHIYKTFYVNDTVIKRGYGYDWVNFTGGHPTPRYDKYKFKWVLYANKFRERNMIK